MRDFKFLHDSQNTQNVNAIVIAIVIVRAETCHKHLKRKHQLFS